jgi:hypothetical protein
LLAGGGTVARGTRIWRWFVLGASTVTVGLIEGIAEATAAVAQA